MLRVVGLILGIVAGFNICGPGLAQAAQEELKIGHITSLTGPGAAEGRIFLSGLQTAVDMINDRGGVLGKKAVIDTADAPTSDAAISEATRLITVDKVQLLTSLMSYITVPASTVAEKYKMFHWNGGAKADAITERGLKYTFQTASKASVDASTDVQFLRDRLVPALGKKVGETRVAIAYGEDPYGANLANIWEKRSKEYGLQVVARESYSKDATDDSSLILRLKQANPDVLLLCSWATDSRILFKQFREFSFLPKALIGQIALNSPEVRGLIGDDLNGTFHGANPILLPDRLLTPQTLALKREIVSYYKKRTGSDAPSSSAMQYWVAGWVLLKYVVPQAGSLDPDKLREAALKVDIDGKDLPTGIGVKFDETGYNVRSTSLVFQYQDLVPLVVHPKEIAEADIKMVPLPPWGTKGSKK